MELPESVLLCLFPNGVVLSPQRQSNGDVDSADEDEDVYYVDVRPPSLPPLLSTVSGATPPVREWAGGAVVRGAKDAYVHDRKGTTQQPAETSEFRC